jgi:hypothetical protein
MNAGRAKAKDQSLMVKQFNSSTIQRFNDSTIQQFYLISGQCLLLFCLSVANQSFATKTLQADALSYGDIKNHVR